jgi:hypothetical protein
VFASQFEHAPSHVVRETGPDPATRAQGFGALEPAVRPCPVLTDPSPAFDAHIPGFTPGTAVEIPETWGVDDSVTLMMELISRGFVDVVIPEALLGHPLLRECDRRSPYGYVALREGGFRCGIEYRIAQHDFQVAARIVYLPSTFSALRARALVSRLRRLEIMSFILIESGLREADVPFRPLLSILEGPRVRAETLLHRLRHGNLEPHE